MPFAICAACQPTASESSNVRAIDEVAEFDVPTAHPNVRQIAGDWAGFVTMRIGIYRAIYRRARLTEFFLRCISLRRL